MVNGERVVDPETFLARAGVLPGETFGDLAVRLGCEPIAALRYLLYNECPTCAYRFFQRAQLLRHRPFDGVCSGFPETAPELVIE